MRHSSVALLVILSTFAFSASSVHADQPSFPYTGFVKTSSVSVLSGPSSEFYATERLKWGSKVEVYRHEGNWAAIRPTEASFSWVKADATRATKDDRVVVVTEPSVFTRVGTQFSDKHTAEYVELKKGEPLEVLGRKEMIDDNGNSIDWLKISPPSGEFRWIRLSALATTPPKAKPARRTNPVEPRLLKSLAAKDSARKTEPRESDATTSQMNGKDASPSRGATVDDQPEIATIERKPREPMPLPADFPTELPLELPADSPARGAAQKAVATASYDSESDTDEESTSQSGWQVITGEDDRISGSSEMKLRPIGSSVKELANETPELARRLKKQINQLADLVKPPTRRDGGKGLVSAKDSASASEYVALADNVVHDPAVRPAQWFTDVSPRPNLDPPARTPNAWREVPQFATRAPRVAAALDSTLRPRTGLAATSARTTNPLPNSRSPQGDSVGPIQSNAKPGVMLPTIKSSLVETPPNHSMLPQPQRRALSPRPPIVGINDRNLLTQELTDIDLELAETVIREPQHWSLELLRIRAQAVIDASQIADLRDRGQRVLAKIAQFEDVQRRSRQMELTSRSEPLSSSAVLASLPRGATSSPESVLASNHFANTQRLVQNQMPNQTTLAANPAPVGLNTPIQTGTAEQVASRGIRYDGEGWLMPVVTARGGMPRFVLTDDDGNVLQFVSPQPGLNLSSYARQRIGVFGQRGYNRHMQKPQLTAERIVSLRR